MITAINILITVLENMDLHGDEGRPLSKTLMIDPMGLPRICHYQVKLLVHSTCISSSTKFASRDTGIQLLHICDSLITLHLISWGVNFSHILHTVNFKDGPYVGMSCSEAGVMVLLFT